MKKARERWSVDELVINLAFNTHTQAHRHRGTVSYPPMMEERQRAKPRARATWLVMQLQCWGSPRNTMEHRKVTIRERSREKLSRASLAFTRGVPRWTRNTTYQERNQRGASTSANEIGRASCRERV